MFRTIAFAAAGAFLLGAAKGQFEDSSKLKAGLLMMLNGGLAGTAAYLVGWKIGG